MKTFRKTFLLLLVCVCLFSVSANAASASSKAKKKYEAYIKTHNLANSVIVDIDKNGIPELLCFDKDSWKSKAYTYNTKTKKMIGLCSIASGKGYGFYYSVKKHYVVMVSSNTGGSRFVIYKISGTKANKVKTYTSSRNYPGFTYTYKINNQKVSETKWFKGINIIKKFSYFNGLMG